MFTTPVTRVEVSVQRHVRRRETALSAALVGAHRSFSDPSVGTRDGEPNRERTKPVVITLTRAAVRLDLI